LANRSTIDEPARPLRAFFYDENEKLVKANAGANPRRLSLTLLDHLQMDHYGAFSAEMIDTRHGELHCQAGFVDGVAVFTFEAPSKKWRREPKE
jgi:hypothetical protein